MISASTSFFVTVNGNSTFNLMSLVNRLSDVLDTNLNRFSFVWMTSKHLFRFRTLHLRKKRNFYLRRIRTVHFRRIRTVHFRRLWNRNIRRLRNFYIRKLWILHFRRLWNFYIKKSRNFSNRILRNSHFRRTWNSNHSLVGCYKPQTKNINRLCRRKWNQTKHPLQIRQRWKFYGKSYII